ACPECTGLGQKMEWDFNKILPDRSLSFNERAFPFFNPESEWNHSMFSAVAEAAGFTLDTPISRLTAQQFEYLWEGDPEKKIHWIYKKQSGEGFSEYNRPWPGVLNEMKRRHAEAWGDTQRSNIEEKFMKIGLCSCCNGQRLRKEALGVTVGGKNIWELCCLSVADSIAFFDQLELSENEQKIAAQVMKEIKARLRFLRDVGLDYLTMERSAETLSGGEAQRIRLATQIGSALCGVMYILDEPSIGLHQRDNQKLIDTLINLRDNGNTVIVVEHDEQTLRTADYLIDIGPGAGVNGGRVVAAGSPDQVAQVKESLTGQYLAGTLKMDIPEKRRPGNGKFIKVNGATEHNLKNVSIQIPLGAFTCITGVSGSGKSTLMSDVLYPALSNRVMRTNYDVGECESVEGFENIDKVINIDQSPIGRSPRSNPATYIGVFDAIRDLYASLPESKARGYQKGRFSFNVKGGRCEACQGAGENVIEMNFLPDVYVTCEVCGGKRFNKETLEVEYKGKSINDVLNMSIDEACDFFASIPHISRKLETLKSVGLGYIELGQNALTLSGGEAQRVKLANELARVSTGKTLYIMDEPTTGLHFADVKQLMGVIQRLVDQGNSVVMIEHNLDVICQADYIIDLGPEGGFRGGNIVTQGSPEEVAKVKESYTGQFIKEMLNKK
ncbi:MAG: excinuclease ABC subunit UvrA, partial [Treponema sp.]|nr:excinuclease ABC subunit UvrA [Treponema sp.]